MADPGGDLGAVLLDLHPPAAAVAELAPREVVVEVLGLSSRPAGRPSTIAIRPGPCDSPAVCEAQRHSAHTLLAKVPDAGLGGVQLGPV